MRFRLIPELPLLRRELTELAARKRTYVLRFVAALLLLSMGSYVVSTEIEQVSLAMGRRLGGAAQISALGVGSVVFPQVAVLLFSAVQLLMPALICGSIAIEKERNTLGTLFVTRLSPLTIVLEKLGSRLIPMLSFIVLSFPVLAWVYAYGGVDSRLVLQTIWLLIWECILYASFGLMCSAWFATTVSAFIASYVVAALVFVLNRVLRAGVPVPFEIWYQVVDWGSFGTRSSADIEQGYWGVILSTWQTAVASVVMVLLSRYFLVTRAEVSRRSVLLRVFRGLDGFFRWLNERTTGGRMVLSEGVSYPQYDPVAWRERAKKSLGKPHYLLRMLLVLQFPVLFVCVGSYAAEALQGLRPVLHLLWVVAVLVISMKAATLMSSERSRETLEALLSTPMSGREILDQKVQGMRRMMLMLCVPIATVHFSNLLMLGNVSFGALGVALGTMFWMSAYFVGSLISTWVMMQLIVWVSLRCGIRGATQARSVLLTHVVLGMWFGLTAVIFPLLEETSSYRYQQPPITQWPASGSTLRISDLLVMIRPDGTLRCCEQLLRCVVPTTSFDWGRNSRATFQTAGEALGVLSLVTLLHWGAYRLLRWHVLSRSNALLNRCPESLAGTV